MTFLCATRLLAAWLVLPFMYMCSIGAGFFASYLVVVQQIGDVSSGGFFLIFWQFQNPPDLLYSLIKAMAMATVIVLVGCYYGYNASGGPGRGRHRDGEVDGPEHRGRTPHRNARYAALLGRQPEGTDRRLSNGRHWRRQPTRSGRPRARRVRRRSRARPTAPGSARPTTNPARACRWSTSSPPRPAPPQGADEDEYEFTPTRCIRPAARTRSSSSTSTSRSGARRSSAG